MSDEMLTEMEEEFKSQMAKRKKSLLRYKIPENRGLLQALVSLTKAELDDIRYNLCVQGVSSLKKQELAEALVEKIEAFSEKWFVTISTEQYEILSKISKNNGISTEIDENDVRMDYMRCLGIVFVGSQADQLAWYMPDEILEIFNRLDTEKFSHAVALNDEVVRLTTGLLFYYGYLQYDVIYEKINSYIGDKLEFIEFMGILVNAGCWQSNIINAQTGIHYYTVIDCEELLNKQQQHKDIDYKAFDYNEVYAAGCVNYIDESESYKALVAFFMSELSLPVLAATDIVGEIFIMLQNDEKFSEMIEYIQSVVELPSQKSAETMIQLLMEFKNNTRRWVLKGHSAYELSPKSKKAIAPVVVQNAPNNLVQFVPQSARVGRNDPCPCGSGKKYKKCCLDKEI